MDEQNQTRFEGFALVEILGHRRVAGMVTTEFIGPAAFLRIVTPEVPLTEITLDKSTWVDDSWIPAGSVVVVCRPRAEILVGAGSIYAITPISESAVAEHAPLEKHIFSTPPKALLEEKPTETVDASFSSDDCQF